jgi:hypothetical protein
MIRTPLHRSITARVEILKANLTASIGLVSLNGNLARCCGCCGVEQLLELILYIVLIGGAASVVWFFQTRRSMLLRMRGVVAILEDVFRPVDKEYTLLGYLVGFRAVYKLRDRLLSRAWLLYIMPPYHVFFYLPVIALGRRRERLEVTLKTSYPLAGEAHVYLRGDGFVRRSVEKDVAGSGRAYSRASMDLDGVLVEALYTGQIALDKALALFRELKGVGVDVRRVSIVDRLHAIHVSLAPSPGTDLRAALRRLLRLARAWGSAGAG